jgi:RimJ/RimL family protein N-acetyltransferase
VFGYGLGSLGLDSPMAVVVPENVGWWRVLERAGMRYEGPADIYGMKGLKK